jgi:hypothetical protein
MTGGRWIFLVLIFDAAFLRAAILPTNDSTYHRDVAPILNRHCVVCHRPNDIGPMSLETYQEARPWAAASREAVATRAMPPWHGDPKSHQFSNDPRLTDAEIATLISWTKTGAKEGPGVNQPASAPLPAGWHIRPDVVLTFPEEQQVPASAQDEYEYIHVPTHFTEDKWVQVAEVLPGNRRIVHHATVSVWDEPAAPQPDATAPAVKPVEYRYRTGKVNHIRPEIPVADDGCATPTGGDWPDNVVKPGIFVAIFLPGHVPEVRPDGYAIRIPKDAILEVQIHYSNRTGQAMTDRTSIGLTFAKAPVSQPVEQFEIWNNLFALPPGDADHRVTSCYTLDRDVLALAYTAHMHFRGKSFQTEARFPDGRTEILFSVPHYDFHWQETYMLTRPPLLPKGTLLRSTATFDNSANNPLNPDPTKLIRWGEPSTEEMMGFWLAFTKP